MGTLDHVGKTTGIQHYFVDASYGPQGGAPTEVVVFGPIWSTQEMVGVRASSGETAELRAFITPGGRLRRYRSDTHGEWNWQELLVDHRIASWSAPQLVEAMPATTVLPSDSRENIDSLDRRFLMRKDSAGAFRFYDVQEGMIVRDEWLQDAVDSLQRIDVAPANLGLTDDRRYMMAWPTAWPNPREGATLTVDGRSYSRSECGIYLVRGDPTIHVLRKGAVAAYGRDAQYRGCITYGGELCSLVTTSTEIFVLRADGSSVGRHGFDQGTRLSQSLQWDVTDGQLYVYVSGGGHLATTCIWSLKAKSWTTCPFDMTDGFDESGRLYVPKSVISRR